MDQSSEGNTILGPFVSNVTASQARVWFQLTSSSQARPVTVYVTLHAEVSEPEPLQATNVVISSASLSVGLVTFENLQPDTRYNYRLWYDPLFTEPVDLGGLMAADLFFRTFPEQGYDEQLDFLLMSCHNPGTSLNDGAEGFAVWRQIPEVISQNKNVRFAILAGDQIYADEVEADVLAEKDTDKRRQLYLDVYRKYWSNLYYRKVLCSLPSVLMWDDHDITDGWGSREDSFVDAKSSVFQSDWLALFQSAREAFMVMQALRNPEPLSPNFGFDTCFRIGRAGFVVADLRSNRNIREGRIWLPEQLAGIRSWVESNREDLDTLFFVSSVVFSHGAPQIERSILKWWFIVLDFLKWFRHIWVLRTVWKKFSEGIGDLRDDINDSWGSDKNACEADRVLDFLFDVQNPSGDELPVNVVILSGDIHTPGYSTIYSANPRHSKRAAIPHIVATPVAYKSFSWTGEAVYRHLTKTVILGSRGVYTSQVSHHFCYRNVVVVSQRNYAQDESHLKVKYYLEGFPEPQVMLFDLNHGSRREAIGWPGPEGVKAPIVPEPCEELSA